MKRTRAVWFVMPVILLTLTACGGLAATPLSEAHAPTATPVLPTFTPTLEPPTTTPPLAPPTATPAPIPPTATPTPVPPTSAPTLEAITGTVQGKLIGAESQQPLTGAAVVLCLVVGEKTCVLQADLVSTSGEDGKFELTEVPPGSYVVFYDPSGKASSSWKEIDGLEMILKLEGLSGFPSRARTELFSTFGGGGKIISQKGTILDFKDGSVVDGVGSIISEEYGLTMDFHEGKPITIIIQPGNITELEIKAWAQ